MPQTLQGVSLFSILRSNSPCAHSLATGYKVQPTRQSPGQCVTVFPAFPPPCPSPTWAGLRHSKLTSPSEPLSGAMSGHYPTALVQAGPLGGSLPQLCLLCLLFIPACPLPTCCPSLPVPRPHTGRALLHVAARRPLLGSPCFSHFPLGSPTTQLWVPSALVSHLQAQRAPGPQNEAGRGARWDPPMAHSPAPASLRTPPHGGSVPRCQSECTNTTLLQFYEGASWAKSKKGLRLRPMLPEGVGGRGGWRSRQDGAAWDPVKVTQGMAPTSSPMGPTAWVRVGALG